MTENIEIKEVNGKRAIIINLKRFFAEELETLSEMYKGYAPMRIIHFACMNVFPKSYTDYDSNLIIESNNDTKEVAERLKESAKGYIERYKRYYEYTDYILESIAKNLYRRANEVIIDKRDLHCYVCKERESHIYMSMKVIYKRKIPITSHHSREGEIKINLSMVYNPYEEWIKVENYIYRRIFYNYGISNRIMRVINEKIEREYKIQMKSLSRDYSLEYYKEQLGKNFQRSIGKILEKHGFTFKIKWTTYDNEYNTIMGHIMLYKENREFLVVRALYKPKAFTVISINHINKEVAIPRELYNRLYRYF